MGTIMPFLKPRHNTLNVPVTSPDDTHLSNSSVKVEQHMIYIRGILHSNRSGTCRSRLQRGDSEDTLPSVSERVNLSGLASSKSCNFPKAIFTSFLVCVGFKYGKMLIVFLVLLVATSVIKLAEIFNTQYLPELFEWLAFQFKLK